MTAKHSPSILLLHGVNVWNTGDLGLLEVTVERLRAELGEDVRIMSEDVFAHPPGVLRPHLERLGIESVPALIPVRERSGLGRGAWLARCIAAALAVMAVRMFGTRALRLVPLTLEEPIRAILRADVVISKAGGHLYATAGRRIGSASYLFTIWSATRLRRPTVLYAQSVGPFSGHLADRIARFAVAGVRLATARDERSYRWLLSALPAARVRLTADEAFQLPSGFRRGDGERRRELGITTVMWRFPGHSNPQKARSEYEEALVNVARWYVDECGGNVSFVRWLTGGHREDDAAQIEALVGRVNRPGHVATIGPFAPREASQRLGQMELLVASRLHSAIFGMVAGTPAVAIEYLPKTSEIVGQVVGRTWSIPIEHTGQDRLAEKVRELRGNLPAIRVLLAQRIPQLRERAAANAQLVRDVLDAAEAEP